MADVMVSLLPVFSLIALGAALRRFSLVNADGWASLERLTYFVLFPPLMFMSIIEGSFAGAQALILGQTLAGAVLVMAALMTLLRPFLARDGAAFSSVFQAGLRWNGYIALGVIAGLFGPEGLSLAAVGFAVLVPINNVLSVLVLSRYAGATPAPALQVVRSIAGNPLILSTLLAIALVQTGLQLSDPVADTLNLLGDATIALGLICVGAALDFGAMRQAKWPLAAGVILRLLVMPVVTFAIGGLLGLAAPALTIAIICVSAPVATSAYILARQLGGDSRLMANIISLTTLVSLVTLPLALLLVQGLAR